MLDVRRVGVFWMILLLLGSPLYCLTSLTELRFDSKYTYQVKALSLFEVWSKIRTNVHVFVTVCTFDQFSCVSCCNFPSKLKNITHLKSSLEGWVWLSG